MAFNLDLQEENGILRVAVTGVRTRDTFVEDSKAAFEEVSKVCRETGLTQILVILRLTGENPVMDVYDIATTLIEWGIQRYWKIAFVNQDPNAFRNALFGETVAVNRGYRVKIFSDEGEARAWLLN